MLSSSELTIKGITLELWSIALISLIACSVSFCIPHLVHLLGFAHFPFPSPSSFPIDVPVICTAVKTRVNDEFIMFILSCSFLWTSSCVKCNVLSFLFILLCQYSPVCFLCLYVKIPFEIVLAAVPALPHSKIQFVLSPHVLTNHPNHMIFILL